MERVDLRAVWRDTLAVRPEIRDHWKVILGAVVVLAVIAAIEYPIELLAAVAIGVAVAMLIRFTSCYLRAREAVG